MKKKVALLSIVAIMSLGGCGSSNVEQDRGVAKAIYANAHKLNMPEMVEPEFVNAHKLTRANWTGVAPLAPGFFITEDNTNQDNQLLSFKIQDDHIADGNYNTETVLIDIDNNPNTGWSNGTWQNIGAEYMIQGRALYRHTAPGWHWEFVRDVDRQIMNNNEVELEFPKSALTNPSLGEDIRAVASLLDNNWNPINELNIVSYHVGGVVVNPVGEYSVSDTQADITFSLISANIANGNAMTESILIDADNNAESGYRNERWANIGAEYMIQGDTLYRHTAAGWHWELIGNVNQNIDGDRMSVTVNKTQMNLSDTIRTIAGLVDNDWRTIERHDIVTTTLQGNGGGNNGGGGNNSAAVSDDAQTLTITLQSNHLANGDATNSEIFIDVANNEASYSNPRWNWGEMSADYLIEGDNLFAYGGEGWSWNHIGRVTRVINNDTLTITIDKNLLDLSQHIRVLPTLVDNSWNVVEQFSATPFDVTGIVDPNPNNQIIIRHDLSFFWLTAQSDSINENSHTEFYVDEDNNPDTGFRINGIGAEYRIIDNQLSALHGTEWGAPFNGEGAGVVRTINGNQVTVRTRRAQLLYTHRHIAVTARVLDENNNLVASIAPVAYEVRGDDDEITLSLDDPEYYTFTIHNRLIDPAHFGHDYIRGSVSTLHLALDMDNNRFTGNQMNAVGADYFTHSHPSLQNTYHFIGLGGDRWIDRWEIVENGHTIVRVRDGEVDILIPRSALPINNPFTIASTLNDTRGHFYWTNRYEFDLGGN